MDIMWLSEHLNGRKSVCYMATSNATHDYLVQRLDVFNQFYEDTVCKLTIKLHFADIRKVHPVRSETAYCKHLESAYQWVDSYVLYVLLYQRNYLQDAVLSWYHAWFANLTMRVIINSCLTRLILCGNYIYVNSLRSSDVCIRQHKGT